MVQLLLELTCVDEPGKLDASGAIENAEGDLHMAVAAEDRLRHQQLVEVGIEHRAHDGVDLPVVIVDAGGDVGHGRSADWSFAAARAACCQCYPLAPARSNGVGLDQATLPAARGRMAR